MFNINVRYQTFSDAMDICEELGERGTFLQNFQSLAEYQVFHETAKKNKAVNKFCAHGGRYIFWLPYR